MKKQIGMLALVLSLVGSSAFAEVVLPPTLGATMKAMQSHLKQIAAQSSNATLNPSSLQLSLEFAALTSHARDFASDAVPASVPNRAEQIALFQKMIDEVALTGQSLAQAFQANDQAKAADILKTLAEQRKQGHLIFN